MDTKSLSRVFFSILILVALLAGTVVLSPPKVAQAQAQEISESGYQISQWTGGTWEGIYQHQFQVQYSTEAFPVNVVDGKVSLRIVQAGSPFADIDQISLTSGSEKLVPDYAQYTANGQSVLGDILELDHNVVLAHEQEIEIAWDLSFASGQVMINLTANEYGHALPFRFPETGYAIYEMGSNPGSLTVDGVITETDGTNPLYSPFWQPVTGHPDGYAYIYVNDDEQNVYFSLDVTGDNTNEFGEDWAEIRILQPDGSVRAFRADDFNSTWGKGGFGLTSKVSYKHQTYEFAIPKSILGNEDIIFDLGYYGTYGGGTYPGTTTNYITINGSSAAGQVYQVGDTLDIDGYVFSSAGIGAALSGDLLQAELHWDIAVQLGSALEASDSASAEANNFGNTATNFVQVPRNNQNISVPLTLTTPGSYDIDLNSTAAVARWISGLNPLKDASSSAQSDTCETTLSFTVEEAGGSDTENYYDTTSDGFISALSETYSEAQSASTGTVDDTSSTIKIGQTFPTETTINQTIADSGYMMDSANYLRVGKRIDGFSGTFSEVQFMLSKDGSPTGDGYVVVRKVSDDSILGTIGNVDVGGLEAWVDDGVYFGDWVTFDDNPVTISTPTDIRICFEYSGGDSGNWVHLAQNSTDSNWGALTEYQASYPIWIDSFDRDAVYKITYTSLSEVDRGYLFFDTSDIPDTATITAATLNFYGATDSSDNDFSINIAYGLNNPSDPLIGTDFAITNYSSSAGALSTADFITSDLNSIVFDPDYLEWISKTGDTRLGLFSNNDIIPTEPSGNEFVMIYSADYESGIYAPYLEVNYDLLPATDSDSDGLTDEEEASLGTDPNNPDSDYDELLDGAEVYDYLTDPLDEDSDDDGLTDGDEVNYKLTDPNDSDSDDDLLTDGEEVDYGTDPNDYDMDDDGLNDYEEVITWGTYPNYSDSDDDGLTDGEEIDHDSDPLSWDSDGDGLSDGDEVHTYGTDPVDADSDRDGLYDGDEVSIYITNPDDSDSDDDSLNDGDEVNTYYTDPNDADSDDDTYGDGAEVRYNVDPTDPLDPVDPSFTSDDSTIFTVGTPGSFTLTATGSPIPDISFVDPEELPTEITWDETTHTLSGTPASGSGATYSLQFIADNGICGQVSQAFTLTINEATSTVTFDKNTGDTEASPPSISDITYGDSVVTLPEPPTKSGYAFLGWNTATDGQGDDFTDSTPVTGDLTVYAQWGYTITASISGSGGQIIPSGNVYVVPGNDQTISIGSYAGYIIDQIIIDDGTISRIQIDKPGTNYPYKFEDVSDSHTISATFAPGWVVSVEDITGSGTVSGTGYNSTAHLGAYYTAETATLTANPAAGNSLTWWRSGSTWENLQTADSINVTSSSDHAYLVRFDPTYTITASAGTGGSVTPPGVTTVEVVWNVSGQLSYPSVTYTIAANTGYQVADVIVDSGSQGPITTYTFSGHSMSDTLTNHTISATFAPVAVSYTVIFDSQGGSTVDSQTVPSGSTLSSFTDPTKTNYQFGGWYTGTNFRTAWNFSSPVTRNMTLYAKWIPNSYNTTVKLAGTKSVKSGQPVTLTATLSVAGINKVVPTSGTVRFNEISFNGSILSTPVDLGDISLTNGQATLTTTLPKGSYIIQAFFSDGSQYNNSTSNNLTVTVK